jgi:hypothetical protein
MKLHIPWPPFRTAQRAVASMWRQELHLKFELVDNRLIVNRGRLWNTWETSICHDKWDVHRI